MVERVAKTWVTPETNSSLGIFVSTVRFSAAFETMVVGGKYDGTRKIDFDYESALNTHLFWFRLLMEEKYGKSPPEAAEGESRRPTTPGDSSSYNP